MLPVRAYVVDLRRGPLGLSFLWRRESINISDRAERNAPIHSVPGYGENVLSPYVGGQKAAGVPLYDAIPALRPFRPWSRLPKEWGQNELIATYNILRIYPFGVGQPPIVRAKQHASPVLLDYPDVPLDVRRARSATINRNTCCPPEYLHRCTVSSMIYCMRSQAAIGYEFIPSLTNLDFTFI
jgi:hypothetical protein